MEAIGTAGSESRLHKLAHKCCGKHPVAALVAIAVLIVIVLVLIFRLRRHRGQGWTNETFYPQWGSNLRTGNRNPLWQFGSADAGLGGSVDRAMTKWNAASVDPAVYQGRRVFLGGGWPNYPGGANLTAAGPYQENLSDGPAAVSGPCPPGTMRDENGMCTSPAFIASQGAATPSNWAPDAAFEAMALREQLASSYVPGVPGTDVNTQMALQPDERALNPVEYQGLTAFGGSGM